MLLGRPSPREDASRTHKGKDADSSEEDGNDSSPLKAQLGGGDTALDPSHHVVFSATAGDSGSNGTGTPGGGGGGGGARWRRAVEAGGGGGGGGGGAAPSSILRSRSQRFSGGHRVNALGGGQSERPPPAHRPLAEAAAVAAAAIVAAELAAEDLQDAMEYEVETGVYEGRASRKQLVGRPSQLLRSGARRVTLKPPAEVGGGGHRSGARLSVVGLSSAAAAAAAAAAGHNESSASAVSGSHPFRVPGASGPVTESSGFSERLSRGAEMYPERPGRDAGHAYGDGSVRIRVTGYGSSSSDGSGGDGDDERAGPLTINLPPACAGARSRRMRRHTGAAGAAGATQPMRLGSGGASAFATDQRRRSPGFRASPVAEAADGAEPLVVRVIPGRSISSIGRAEMGSLQSVPEAISPKSPRSVVAHTTPSDMGKSDRNSQRTNKDGRLSNLDSQLNGSASTTANGGPGPNKRVIKMIRSFGKRSHTGRHKVNQWADQAAEAAKGGRAVASGGQLAVALLLRGYRTTERVRRPLENLLKVAAVVQAFLPAVARMRKGQPPFGTTPPEILFFWTLCVIRILG